jgi:prepilin-type processing-associated H-X9-DG protein
MKSRMSFSCRLLGGFTVVDMLVVIACLFLLGMLLLPALTQPGSRRSPRIACANNLKQVGLAFMTFAIDNNDSYPMQLSVAKGGCQEKMLGTVAGPVSIVFQCMSNELSTPKILVCPDDRKRTCATNFLSLDDKGVSYFVGLDATKGDPSSWLSGDRHLTSRVTSSHPYLILSTNSALGWTKELHSGAGNICFADGRVAGLTNASLRAAIQALGDATNRLAVP